MPAGRPTDYRPEFCRTAIEMSQFGATDREIAEALEVDERTIYRWKHSHPEFCQALQLGKEAADDRVENALYRRAVGYSFDSVHITSYEGDVTLTPIVEHVPPDVNAGKLWLTNRRPEKWRDKRDHELTGKNGGPIQTLAASMTPEQAAQAYRELMG